MQPQELEEHTYRWMLFFMWRMLMTANNRLKLSERCLPALPLLAGFFFSSCSNVSGHISDLNWTVTVAYRASFHTLFPVRSRILSTNPHLKHIVMCLGWLTAVPNRIWFACSNYLTYCQWLIKAHLCCFTSYYRIHTETGWVTLGKVSYLLSRDQKNVGVSFPSEYYWLWRLKADSYCLRSHLLTKLGTDPTAVVTERWK